MTNLLPGQVITLPDADIAILERHLTNEVTNLETKYAEYFKKLAIWWRWYDAEPRMKKKTFPFLGASNIVVPLIQIMSDSLIARAFSSVFGAGERVWTARTENQDNTGVARDMARYMNWQAAGNDYDLRLAIYDCFSELYPIGSSVLALNWRNDERFVYAPGTRGGKFSRSVAQKVRFGRGPLVEHAPRENYLWDTAHNIADAPIVVRELAYTWSQLKSLHQHQPKAWRGEVIDSIRGESGQEGPGREVTQSKKASDSQLEFSLDQFTEPHDIREIHVDWPVMENFGFSKRGQESLETPDIPIVATLHRRTGKILQLKAEPYNLAHKPFFDFFFRKRSGRGHAVGAAKRLEHMQSMMTTQFNQSIDKDTRANAVWAITSSRKHLESPIDPSHPIYAPGMLKEFAPFALQNNPGPELGLIQAAQVMAERQMGIFDPAMGRESRQGGHPSPATSTLALLENTDVMAAPTMTMIRRQLSRMGEAIAILNQQFETDEDGKIARVLGPEDGQRVSSFLFPQEPIPGNYIFDIVALSPQSNPDAEMSRAVQVGQMNQLYWGQVIQGVQIMENPKVGPMVKQAWLKYIDSMTNTYMRFLESANVDEIEKFTLNLRAAQQQGAQQLRSVNGDPGGANGPQGSPQQLPMGQPQGSPVGGEAFSFGEAG